MKISAVHLTLVLLGALSSCSDSATGGAASASSTDTTTGQGGTTPCPSGYELWSQPGVRYDPALECVDVSAENILFIDNCRSTNDAETDAPEFYCFRRLSDGAEYWINNVFFLVLPIEDEWEFCDGSATVGLLPPRPCFAECEPTELGHEEPLSTCAEGATRQFFACGQESKWDENCCRRQFCDPQTPCPEGYECREAWVTTPASYCWVGIGPDADPETVDLNDAFEACSCVGAVNPPDNRCFPIGE